VDYWLIDLSTGAGQGCYANLNEALQAVVDEEQASVEQRPDPLAIVVFHSDGSLEQVGHGEALIAQAHEQYPPIGCRYGVMEDENTNESTANARPARAARA